MPADQHYQSYPVNHLSKERAPDVSVQHSIFYSKLLKNIVFEAFIIKSIIFIKKCIMHKNTAHCMKGVCQLWTLEAQGLPEQPWTSVTEQEQGSH